MAARTYPHSIRFTQEEWRAVREAAERLDMGPGAFVRDAAARAAADELDLDEGRLTPELVELFKPCLSGLRIHTLGVDCVGKMASQSILHIVGVCVNRIGTLQANLSRRSPARAAEARGTRTGRQSRRLREGGGGGTDPPEQDARGGRRGRRRMSAGRSSERFLSVRYRPIHGRRDRRARLVASPGSRFRTLETPGCGISRRYFVSSMRTWNDR